MIERPRQANCQNEPPYPGAGVSVVFVLYAPDTLCHLAHPDCTEEYPHGFDECGLMKPEASDEVTHPSIGG